MQRMVLTRTISEEITWSDIQKMLQEGTHIFQLYPGIIIKEELKNRKLQEWVVTDLGSEYIRFEARNCIGNKYHKMNRDCTNVGGIASSLMQEYLNNDIWNLLPGDLQDVISTVDRKYMDGAEEKTYQTKLFLPSASEVFNENNCFGEENLYKQLYYYKDCRHRIKRDGFWCGSAPWWLSSPLSGTESGFCSVTTAGASDYNSASYSLGVAPCFMITKS